MATSVPDRRGCDSASERSRPEAARPDLAAPARDRRSPWILAIVIGLVLMVLVNLAFIYLAVSDADQVVPSYQLEHR